MAFYRYESRIPGRNFDEPYGAYLYATTSATAFTSLFSFAEPRPETEADRGNGNDCLSFGYHGIAIYRLDRGGCLQALGNGLK